MSGKLLSAILLALFLSLALSGPLGASPEATTTFRFQIDETVVVYIRRCWEQSVSLNVEELRLGLERYLYFPCNLEVVTAAITNYELRFAAEATVFKGISQQRIDVEPLEVRLLEDEMSGLACLPSTDRVAVNERAVEFVPAVELPDSLLLFTGCNNTANPLTTAPLAARLDLSKLPGAALSTGSQVVFTLKFIIIER